MGLKIWERYLLKEIAKVFFLFIGSFYFLYVLIDYSVHARLLHQPHVHFPDIIQYYFHHFSKRADLLILFALLLASIRVLSALNSHNEAVALLAGGIPMKRVLRPLFLAAIVCAGSLYANAEWVSPHSMATLQRFRELNFHDGKGVNHKKPVNELVLADGSRILYQQYDDTKKALFDSFWLKNPDEIYRIRHLVISGTAPLAEFVDYLSRDDQGALVATASYETLHFDEMVLLPGSLEAVVVPIKNEPLSTIWERQTTFTPVLTDAEAEILSFFYYKLTFPLTCFLLVIGVAPFCLRFDRHFHSFPIYTLGIFSLVSFATLMDSAVILGSTQVLPPLIAVTGPMIAIFALLGYRYARWR